MTQLFSINHSRQNIDGRLVAGTATLENCLKIGSWYCHPVFPVVAVLRAADSGASLVLGPSVGHPLCAAVAAATRALICPGRAAHLATVNQRRTRRTAPANDSRTAATASVRPSPTAVRPPSDRRAVRHRPPSDRGQPDDRLCRRLGVRPWEGGRETGDGRRRLQCRGVTHTELSLTRCRRGTRTDWL